MSEAREDPASLLCEYLETEQSEWVHHEIEGKPDRLWNRCQVAPPDGEAVIVRTDAAAIRMLINTMVQTIEAASLK